MKTRRTDSRHERLRKWWETEKKVWLDPYNPALVLLLFTLPLLIFIIYIIVNELRAG